MKTFVNNTLALMVFILLIIISQIADSFLSQQMNPIISNLIITGTASILVVLIVYYYLFNTNAVFTKWSLLILSIYWLSGTLLFHFLVGHYSMHISFYSLLNDFNLIDGSLLLLIPIAQIVIPVIFYYKRLQ